MKKFFVVLTVLAFVFCVVPLRAEEVKAKCEPVNLIMIPIGIFGSMITVPVRAMIAGAVNLNNAIYKNAPRCYYCTTGEDHTPEQCTAKK